MGKIAIGELRQRVRLQAFALTPDGGGGYAESWSDLAEIWARVRPLTGVELTLGEQRQHRVTHEVVIRYRLGIQPGQRLIYDGRALYILGIVNADERNILGIVNADERNAFLALHCEERATP